MVAPGARGEVRIVIDRAPMESPINHAVRPARMRAWRCLPGAQRAAPRLLHRQRVTAAGDGLRGGRRGATVYRLVTSQPARVTRRCGF